MTSKRALIFCSYIAVGLALAYLAIRGPVRAWGSSVDLPTFYSASRAWVYGHDPYNHETLVKIYEKSGGDNQSVAICVNPPSFFPVMSPLAATPYQAAKKIMVVLSLGAFALALWLIGRVTGPQGPIPWAALLLTTALASVHTTLSQGQQGLLVLAALAGALAAQTRQRELVVGLCLALAAAFKPQMVLLFGVYYLFRRRWAVVAAGAAGTAALVSIGAGRMWLAGIDWFNGFSDNMAAFTGSVFNPVDMSGAGNYAAMGRGRYIMLDIAAPLHAVTDHPVAIGAARLTVGAAALAVAIWQTLRPRPTTTQMLLAYATLSVGGLACMYNRHYAATLLVFVVAAAIRLIIEKRTLAGGLLLTMCLPFAVPGAAVMRRLENGPWKNSAVTRSALWEYVLYPHQTYLLLAMLVVLAVAANHRQNPDSKSSATGSNNADG